MSMCFALEGDNFLDCTASRWVCSVLRFQSHFYTETSPQWKCLMSYLGFSKQLLFIFPSASQIFLSKGSDENVVSMMSKCYNI